MDRSEPGDTRFRETPLVQTGSQIPDAREGRREPWEIWAPYQDLRGRAIENAAILRGDEYLRTRQLQRALQEYQTAHSGALPPSEHEAVVLRMASTQLALDNPQSSLSSMTEFFRSTGRVEEQVDDRFSVIFGYAYGRMGNYHQSLAWFSRAYRLGSDRVGVRSASDSGARALLRSMPQDEFLTLAEQWKADLFVSQLIGQEMRRRTQDTFDPTTDRTGRFWDRDRGMQILPPGSMVQVDRGRVLVAAFLPISGRYSQLGQSTREGLELAAMSYPELVQIEVRDTAGERARGTAELRSVLAAGSAGLVIGPLISEVADDFVPLARSSRTPMLALSKRSYFPTGGGVYRLGPTIESQLDSLVDVAYYSQSRRRFGVVHANTESGRYHADVFRAKLRSLGLTPEFEKSYTAGDEASLVSVAQELEASSIDALFVPDSVTVVARLFANLSMEARQRIRLMGLANWDNPTQLAQSRGAMGRAMFVSPFFLGSQRPVVKKFIESYRNRFGSQPDFLAAQGFDAGMLAFSALSRGQEIGLSLEQALLEIERYDGLTGSIRVLPSGEIERRLTVVELVGADIREIPLEAPLSRAANSQVPTYTGDSAGYFRSGGAADPVLEYP